MEDPKELERIDSEKRKYEIMREHYKDDWLKALLADQGRLTENKTEDQSIAEDQSIEPEIVTATVKAEEAVNVEPKAEGEIAVQDAVIEKELAPQSSGMFDIHLTNVVGLARLIEILVYWSIYNRKMIIYMKIQKSVTFNGCSDCSVYSIKIKA